MNNQVNLAKLAEMQASILLNHANFLSEASTSKDNYKIIAALDSNLKLWVEIETSMKNTKNLLPTDVKDNLLKLSKFVERLTLSKGLKMAKADYNTLVNINMQISEGLLESVKNTLACEEAFSLLKCAIDLSNARENKNSQAIATALDNNMQLWVYIKTLMVEEKTKLPKETRNNLIKLADYVSGKTLEIGKNISKINEKSLDSIIMTNLQISEGLMTKNKIA